MRFKSHLGRTGLDRAVVYAVSARLWGLISSVVMMTLILRHLNAAEQGYYYMFSSILAAQILFELGLGVVITQFASHTMAKLAWTKEGTVDGEPEAKERLRSLTRLAARWYLTLGGVAITVLGPAGWLVLDHADPVTIVHWKPAWVWLIFSSAANLSVLPMLALLDGCGCVTDVASIRLRQSIMGSFVPWATLLLGGGLFALPAWNTALVTIACVTILRRRGVFFRDMLFTRAGTGRRISWKKEIWPFQWRIAVSWLSGYFIFQLFVPVLFTVRGPVEAGRMGFGLALANALTGIPLSWLNTKTPRFGAFVAGGDYERLDRLFMTTLIITVGLISLGGLGLISLNHILHAYEFRLSGRILEPLPFDLLIVATIVNFMTIVEASYLRAHIEEPFLFVSLTSGLTIGVSTLLTASPFGATGIMTGYLVFSTLIGLGWGTRIFITKRRLYRERAVSPVPHQEEARDLG